MFEEITQAELVNKGVEGLPDTPNLETAEMQRKFDEITKEVIVPKFNALIQKLNNDLGSDISMIDPKDDTSKTLSALIGEIEEEVGLNTDDRHNHANKALLDSLTAILFEGYNRLVTLLAGVNSVTDVVTNDTTVLPSGKAIVDFVQQMGGGDMLKEVYDTDNDGVVDNADALNGHPDTYFATVTALQALGSLITALQELVASEGTGATTKTFLAVENGLDKAKLSINPAGEVKASVSNDGGQTWQDQTIGGDKSDLATVEPGTTATAPYAAGDHVVVNNVYHEVTAAIAIGDTFVEGTNIDVKTVGGEITALNQNLMQSLTYNENTKYYGSYFNGVWKDVLFYDPEAPDCEVEYILNDGNSSTTAHTYTYNVHKNGVYAIIKGGANSAGGMSISVNGTILFSNSYYTVARMNAGDQVSVTNTVTGNYKYGFGVVYLGSVASSITNITSGIGTATPCTQTFNATNANTVCIMLSNMAASVATGTNIEVSGASADGTLSYKQMGGVANIACMAYRKNPLNGAVAMKATYSQGYHPSQTVVQFNIE